MNDGKSGFINPACVGGGGSLISPYMTKDASPSLRGVCTAPLAKERSNQYDCVWTHSCEELGCCESIGKEVFV